MEKEVSNTVKVYQPCFALKEDIQEDLKEHCDESIFEMGGWTVEAKRSYGMWKYSGVQKKERTCQMHFSNAKHLLRLEMVHWKTAPRKMDS